MIFILLKMLSLIGIWTPFHLSFLYLYERGIIDLVASRDGPFVIITCLYDG